MIFVNPEYDSSCNAAWGWAQDEYFTASNLLGRWLPSGFRGSDPFICGPQTNTNRERNIEESSELRRRRTMVPRFPSRLCMIRVLSPVWQAHARHKCADLWRWYLQLGSRECRIIIPHGWRSPVRPEKALAAKSRSCVWCCFQNLAFSQPACVALNAIIVPRAWVEALRSTQALEITSTFHLTQAIRNALGSA